MARLSVGIPSRWGAYRGLAAWDSPNIRADDDGLLSAWPGLRGSDLDIAVENRAISGPRLTRPGYSPVPVIDFESSAAGTVDSGTRPIEQRGIHEVVTMPRPMARHSGAQCRSWCMHHSQHWACPGELPAQRIRRGRRILVRPYPDVAPCRKLSARASL